MVFAVVAENFRCILKSLERPGSIQPIQGPADRASDRHNSPHTSAEGRKKRWATKERMMSDKCLPDHPARMLVCVRLFLIMAPVARIDSSAAAEPVKNAKVSSWYVTSLN